ncbi:AGR053Wp [Eremothecium gossypii ATCC 10895]|uniref:DNA polymerase epsilon subunit D n=1 Tax=Eremothecium gossypii (strain ATCC 10895 / CBS 109.51 / FGSC 9923 / NRRL Y-1056) TaxID=284811 RepID=DPB4_EREGS|nr:AGR053Wp [Eremothecium gossypii ATCC 10895]Q750A4.1 RecName: Full=DNA polymerase epsilon subunit D; AltName: Full=DNA polymerase II subunit D [Eremothecium gossypii ATCC 10895]AAS54542.1 AGR053Wp [Eremothecium gossypii ATCC 10895]AEY98874.1 FAGR053Wp [Eremothecium gossypii FDAG1]
MVCGESNAAAISAKYVDNDPLQRPAARATPANESHICDLMPPKGWKKDAQGNYPTTSYIKEQEKLTVDDLLFPRSIITSLAKDAVHQAVQTAEQDPRVMLSKDASLALQRSSTVFVNHLLMHARQIAQSNDRKSCSGEDVLKALDQIGLAGFESVVRERVVEYEKEVQRRRAEKTPAADEGQAEEGDAADEEEGSHKRAKLDEH